MTADELIAVLESATPDQTRRIWDLLGIHHAPIRDQDVNIMPLTGLFERVKRPLPPAFPSPPVVLSDPAPAPGRPWIESAAREHARGCGPETVATFPPGTCSHGYGPDTVGVFPPGRADTTEQVLAHVRGEEVADG